MTAVGEMQLAILTGPKHETLLYVDGVPEELPNSYTSEEADIITIPADSHVIAVQTRVLFGGVRSSLL